MYHVGDIFIYDGFLATVTFVHEYVDDTTGGIMQQDIAIAYSDLRGNPMREFLRIDTLDSDPRIHYAPYNYSR